MGRHHVTAAMEKQLRDKREARANRLRGGVMLVPRIASVDEWEKAARASQAALIIHTRDEALPPSPPAPKPAPNVENERLYRENEKHITEGLKQFRDATEAEVRRKTVVR